MCVGVQVCRGEEMQSSRVAEVQRWTSGAVVVRWRGGVEERYRV